MVGNRAMKKVRNPLWKIEGETGRVVKYDTISEAARLNGWVKSPAEAREETGIDNAAELYGTNYKLKSVKLLEAGLSA